MYAMKKIVITSLSILLLGTLSSVLAATAPSRVVLSGIDSPRGMDLDSNGNLYVADAGFGGSGLPFLLTRSSVFGPICQGNSGKVFMVTPRGNVKTIIKNLPSHAQCQDFNGPVGFVPKGSVAFGINGLKVSENYFDKVTLFATFSGSTEEVNDFCLPGGVIVTPGPPDSTSCRPGFSPTNPYNLVQSLKQLWGSNVNIYNTVGQIKVDNNPQYEVLFDRMKYIEDQFNVDSINTAGTNKFPGPTNEENDVYDLLLLNNRILAVDAGANAIWSLRDNGNVSIAVIMPNVGCSKAPCTVGSDLPESVPTAIAQNPKNGKIYIGELAGAVPGIARIFEANFSTSPATLTPVTITGDQTTFTSIVGMAFDKRGNLYVVEYSKTGFAVPPLVGAPGALIKLHFNDAHNAEATVIDDETLIGPTGVTVGNGKIYVGNNQDVGLHQAEVRAYNIP